MMILLGKMIEWKSHEIRYEALMNFYRCHNKCFHTPSCNWFTSFGEGGICNLYETCAFINEDTCPTCVSGEVECPICGLEGICQGAEIHYEVVDSEMACEV